MEKTEDHIKLLSREIDKNLSQALGEMVVAFGRLEDMFKVSFKRLNPPKTLKDVIEQFTGPNGNLGNLITFCLKNFLQLKDQCDKARVLNADRNEFIHATFAHTPEGKYIRFRTLVGYTGLEEDIKKIKDITERVNSLIEDLDAQTGKPLANFGTRVIATTSAAISGPISVYLDRKS